MKNEVCFSIVQKRISTSPVKYYDLLLLISSAVFFLYLLFRFRKLCKGLFTLNGTIINLLYIMLFLACVLKIVRSSLSISSDKESLAIVDKVLWLLVRFFQLSIEMSIVTFGVATARLNGRAGIRRVLLVAFLISLTYSTIQATLEFRLSHPRFYSPSTQSYIFSQGGSVFYFSSSAIFFLIYCTVLILPKVPLSRRIRLPTKKMFYVYCGILATIYLMGAVAGIMLFRNISEGLCLLDVTSFLYFGFYDPLVYVTFLHKYLARRRLTFRAEGYVVECPDFVSDVTKSYTSSTDSINYNHRAPPHSINSNDKFEDCVEQEIVSRSAEQRAEFYPDHCIVMDPSTNIAELMEGFYIVPEGARLEYVGRPPSSTLGSEPPTDDPRSLIDSISYDAVPTNNRNVDMDDFAGK